MSHSHEKAMIRQIIFTILFAVAVTASGYDACVGGIYYNISDTTASVVSGDNRYEGYVDIPFYIHYDSRDYQVTAIESRAFYGCSQLTGVNLPSSLITIGDYAFHGCSRLKSVTVPSRVLSIGQYAFFGCWQLDSLVLGRSVKTIGNNAFEDCRHLTSIRLPRSIELIGEMAFRDCHNLASVEVGRAMGKVGNDAFSGCTRLRSVNIYDITGWCQSVFLSAKSNPLIYAHRLYLDGKELHTLDIPMMVKSIGAYAFEECHSLVRVTVPSTVESIGTYAFHGCQHMSSIELLSRLARIENYSFAECTSLLSIDIPESVKEIGVYAFSSCSELRTVNLPTKLIAIGNYAFSHCQRLSTINIPASVTKIGLKAFASSAICSVTAQWRQPISISSDVFSNVDVARAMLYVPYGKIGEYKSAPVWRSFKNIESVSSVADNDVVNDDIANNDVAINDVVNEDIIADDDMDETLTSQESHHESSALSTVVPATIHLDQPATVATPVVESLQEPLQVTEPLQDTLPVAESHQDTLLVAEPLHEPHPVVESLHESLPVIEVLNRSSYLPLQENTDTPYFMLYLRTYPEIRSALPIYLKNGKKLNGYLFDLYLNKH